MVKGLDKLFKSPLSNPILILTIVILLAVVVFTIYRYFKPVKENFDATSIGINNSGTLPPATGGTGPSASTVISGIGTFIAKSSEPVTAQSPAVTSIIPKPIDFQELENLCAGVSDPLRLRRHKPKDISGCGWYYKDDTNEYSFPAYGTVKGPINPKMIERANGGQWFFKDLWQAQRKEDIKRCKKITSCQIADLYPSVCGFCPTLGYGVPLDKNKLSKYPKTHGASCKSNIVHVPTKCPKQEKDKGATRDAKGKMHYPKPLPPPVCDPLQGKMSRKCLKFLAKSAGVQEEGNLIDMIDGDSKKHFREGTNENRMFKKIMGILKKYAKLPLDMEILGNGRCKRSAAIQYYVKLVDLTGYGINELTRQAAGYLTRGTKFPMEQFMKNHTGPFLLPDLTNAFIKSGCQPAGTAYPKEEDVPNFDGKKMSDIQKEFDKLYKNVYSTDTAVQKDSIKKCLGIGLSTPTPGCDQKPVFVFNGATCQPGNSLIGDVSQKPTTGVEIFWYSWDSDLTFPERRNPVATFYGREIRMSLPSIAPGDPVSSPFSTTDALAFMARSVLTYKGALYNSTYNFTSTEGVAVKVNGATSYRSWIEGTAGTGVSNNFKMTPLEKNYTELYWFSSKPSAGKLTVEYKDIKGHNVPVPQNLCNTRVPKGFPIARWDFFTGEAQERNNILSTSMSSSGFTFENFNNSNCMKFTGGNSWVKTDNKIRGSAFRTFTSMIYYDPYTTATQTNSYIFALRKNAGTDAAPNFLDGAAIEAGIGKAGFVFAVLKPGNSVPTVAAPGTLAGSGDAATSVFASAGAGAAAAAVPLSQANLLRVKTKDGSLMPNMWNHVAIVFSIDYTTITIYINGVSAAKESGVVDTKFYNTMIFDYASMGLSYASTTAATAVNAFKGGMAWQHWFDYPLCPPEVVQDQKNQFCDPLLYPVYKDFGWTMSCPISVAPLPPPPVILPPPPVSPAKVADILLPFTLLQLQQGFIMGGGKATGGAYPKAQIMADQFNLASGTKPGYTLTDFVNSTKKMCGPTSALPMDIKEKMCFDSGPLPPPPTLPSPPPPVIAPVKAATIAAQAAAAVVASAPTSAAAKASAAAATASVVAAQAAAAAPTSAPAQAAAVTAAAAAKKAATAAAASLPSSEPAAAAAAASKVAATSIAKPPPPPTPVVAATAALQAAKASAAVAPPAAAAPAQAAVAAAKASLVAAQTAAVSPTSATAQAAAVAAATTAAKAATTAAVAMPTSAPAQAAKAATKTAVASVTTPSPAGAPIANIAMNAATVPGLAPVAPAGTKIPVIATLASLPPIVVYSPTKAPITAAASAANAAGISLIDKARMPPFTIDHLQQILLAAGMTNKGSLYSKLLTANGLAEINKMNKSAGTLINQYGAICGGGGGFTNGIAPKDAPAQCGWIVPPIQGVNTVPLVTSVTIPPPKCAKPNADVPEMVEGWFYQGCYRDCSQGRGLPVRLANVKTIEQCIAQAKAKGFNAAGNQYYGECWAGNNVDWDRMGNAGCCPPIGGGCNQQIYTSYAKKPPFVPPVPKVVPKPPMPMPVPKPMPAPKPPVVAAKAPVAVPKK